ncbi:MAG TPA: FKBP-type peptidyl-prolyl cis-trans isomerase [Chitinivibrionales bacterium]|nr:FKBP-type peptidyl-prolyl cis-trans isomerase [Chitinivibrionales bacterium]
MKKSLIILACAGLACLALFSCSSKQRMTELSSKQQKVSYTIGQDMGAYLKQMGLTIDRAALFQGIEDTLTGKKSLLTPEEAFRVKQEFSKTVQEEQTAKAKALGEKNSKEGEAFLAKNKTEKGVITTASGLQYMIEKQGAGPKPKASDLVTVNYRGTLVDGKEFDNSYKRGQPSTFAVGRVIPGWTEGLQLLPVGTKAKLFVPANLAYGERGAAPDIGPDATLIFEVEVLSVQPNKDYSPAVVQHIK